MEYRKEIDIVECDLVYPPMEDTLLLLEQLNIHAGERVLEMGCGTGLISCHLAYAKVMLTAADVNPRAVACTRENLKRNGLVGQVVESDLFSNVPGLFDLIVFNPPYLAAEEQGVLERAWAGGREGLDVLAPFLEQAPGHMAPGGRMLVLFSSEMETTGLDRLLMAFQRVCRGSRHLFFEELWVEELALR